MQDHTFILVFETEAAKTEEAAEKEENGAKEKGKIEWLLQGTLYPDVIENINFEGPSAIIKTHHDVGGLLKAMKLKLIELLHELFKDEVRALETPVDIGTFSPFSKSWSDYSDFWSRHTRTSEDLATSGSYLYRGVSQSKSPIKLARPWSSYSYEGCWHDGGQAHIRTGMRSLPKSHIGYCPASQTK